jgi:tRNA(Ile)-lysidine synthase
LHLAHLNHGLRGDAAARDAHFVRQVAQQHNWSLTIEERPIGTLARSRGLSVEECGRRERYAFFRRVLQQEAAQVVATAHHADDNAETILHRVCRGTGLRGLAGIPPVRGLGAGHASRVIRPLLGLRRADLAAYLHHRGRTCCIDASNDDLQPLRNRIRHELIPLLKSKYNPGIVPALLRLGRQSRWFKEHADTCVEQSLRSVASEINPRCVILTIPALLREPRIFQTDVIRRCMGLLGSGEKKLGFVHLTAVLELARRGIPGKQLQLPGGVRVTCAQDQLRLERP